MSAKKAAIASIATTNITKVDKVTTLVQAESAIKAAEEEAVVTGEAAVAAVQATLMLTLMTFQSADLTQKAAASYTLELVMTATVSEAIEFVRIKTLEAEEIVALVIAAAKAAMSKHASDKQKAEELVMYEEIIMEVDAKAAAAQEVALEYAKLFSHKTEEANKIRVCASVVMDSKVAELTRNQLRANYLDVVRGSIVIGLDAIPKRFIRRFIEIKAKH